jgi:enoyl-CoA hydratase
MSVDPSSRLVLPSYETVLLDLDGPVATLTLNRPQVMNALNGQVFNDLETALTHLIADPTIRVILLTGAGKKAFAAGADINELALTDAKSGEALALRGQAVFALLETCGKPTIACINGFALGGGCELALACTLRIASESARMGQPEAKLGLIPGYGATQRLPRLIGRSAALRLILTADPIAADEALRIGLVDEVVPAAELLKHAGAVALKIAAQAPLAVSAAIEAVNQGADLPLNDALALEAHIFGRLSGSSDKKEGVAAFLEKRTAIFTGK